MTTDQRWRLDLRTVSVGTAANAVRKCLASTNWTLVFLPLSLSACLSTYLADTNFYLEHRTFPSDSDFVAEVRDRLEPFGISCRDPSIQSVFLECAVNEETVDIYLLVQNEFYVVRVRTWNSAFGFSPSLPDSHYEYAGLTQEVLADLPISHIEREEQGKVVRILSAGEKP